MVKANKRKDVIFLKSIEGGRYAIFMKFDQIKPPKSDAGVPSITNIEGEFKILEFPGSDTVINGVQRQFWLVSVPRLVFRELLEEDKACLLEGSRSFFRRTMMGPAQNLVAKAYEVLTKEKQEAA